MATTRGSVGPVVLGRSVVARAIAACARMSAPAWGAAALAAAFVALTGWWLSVDRAMPYNDAAQHLLFAFGFRDHLSEGHLLQAIDFGSFYPPATYLIGALATYVGGIDVAAPILAQNILFVPLLTLACYRVGRLLGGPAAGLLAVLFALGAPLVIEQFHVFMLDVPQAAIVAATVWLVLESARFRRVGVAALAGVAFGFALETKQLAPLYLAGLLACVLARGGGWRNWRGLLAFAVAAFVVGAPWYLRQLMLHNGLGIEAAGPGGDVPPAARPSVLSPANLTWYLWATLDGLLFAPLFAFAAVGVGAAVARVARRRPLDDPTPELLAGLVGAWLALSLMPHHDMRYTLGLIVFLSVLGTAWIVRLAPAPRALATGLLVVAIAAAHVGATFGIGGATTRLLPGDRTAAYGEGVPPRNRVIVYENHDYMVSGPHRSPDMLGLLDVLKAAGIHVIQWDDLINRWEPYLEGIGLFVMARIAGLEMVPQQTMTPGLDAGEASLIRARTMEGLGAPCIRFPDGSGLWIRAALGDGNPPRVVCPRRA